MAGVRPHSVILALLVALVMGVIPLFGTTVVGLFNAFTTAMGG